MNARWKSLPRPMTLMSCFWLLIFWICSIPSVALAQSGVTIISFTATWINDDVTIAWETDIETETEGFYVQRSDSQGGVFTRISGLIPSIGDAQAGATYNHTDTNATSGIVYWYKLEIIDSDEQSEFFGPVSADPTLLTPTVTGTNATVTVTSTPTSTLQVSPTANLTPAASTPSGTAYPAPATATQPLVQLTNTPLLPTQPLLQTPGILTLTGTISATTVVSPTATLIPLPDITLTFPPGGILLQERGSATDALAPAQQSASTVGRNPYGGVMLLTVILVIWILLGVWFYLSFRRIE